MWYISGADVYTKFSALGFPGSRKSSPLLTRYLYWLGVTEMNTSSALVLNGGYIYTQPFSSCGAPVGWEWVIWAFALLASHWFPDWCWTLTRWPAAFTFPLILLFPLFSLDYEIRPAISAAVRLRRWCVRMTRRWQKCTEGIREPLTAEQRRDSVVWSVPAALNRCILKELLRFCGFLVQE